MIGNSGGGKTMLSRKLGDLYNIQVTHVDSIQFLPGMKIRPMDETRKILREIENQEHWFIDGYGPLDMIENRFTLADKIIFVDFPLWRHFWWCTKRQLKSFLGFKRKELPDACFDNSWAHTVKLFKTVWKVHTQMRPELIRILSRENLRNKVVFITRLDQFNYLFSQSIR